MKINKLRRKHVEHCSRCGKPTGRKHRYCRPCFAAYCREWRKTHKPEGQARMRANARSYAGVYYRRGKIKKLPCADCGAQKTQMHHEDYSKPLEVIWLCRPCHLARHQHPAKTVKKAA